jgi:hypothetical protein
LGVDLRHGRYDGGNVVEGHRVETHLGRGGGGGFNRRIGERLLREVDRGLSFELDHLAIDLELSPGGRRPNEANEG